MTDQFTPVFSFDGELTDAAEFDSLMADAENNTRKPSKVFKPGSYDVTVKGVRLLGPTLADKTWMKALITYAGTGENEGKEISSLVLVPMSASLKYSKADGEGSIYPFKNLMETLACLGITLTRDNVKSVIPQHFAPANLNTLVGRTCTAKIGYKGAYAQGQKASSGEGFEVVIMNYGEAYKDDTGTVITFSGDNAYADAEKYAAEIGLTFASFPDIVQLSAPKVEDTDSAGSW